MRYPTAGLAKTYKMGRNDMIKPMISGETPSSLPNTRICGKIGPIARKWTNQTLWILLLQTEFNQLVLKILYLP